MTRHVEHVIFLHIPKTGGSSIAHALRRTMGGRAVFGNYNPDADRVVARIPAHKIGNVKVFVGHFIYGLHERLTADAIYFTLLRDPVERVISLYHHIQRANKTRLRPIPGRFPAADRLDAFLDHAESVELDNAMTRRISGHGLDPSPVPIEALERAKANLRGRFVFGLTERFDLSLRLLGRALKRDDLPVFRNNVTPDHQRREVSGAVPGTLPGAGAIRKRIEAMNGLDRELYEWAKVEFEMTVRIAGLVPTPRAKHSDRMADLLTVAYRAGVAGVPADRMIDAAGTRFFRDEVERVRQALTPA